MGSTHTGLPWLPQGLRAHFPNLKCLLPSSTPPQERYSAAQALPYYHNQSIKVRFLQDHLHPAGGSHLHHNSPHQGYKRVPLPCETPPRPSTLHFQLRRVPHPGPSDTHPPGAAPSCWDVTPRGPPVREPQPANRSSHRRSGDWTPRLADSGCGPLEDSSVLSVHPLAEEGTTAGSACTG